MTADISATSTSIAGHVTTAIGGLADWTLIEGAPRSYSPPQINIWWDGIPQLPEPMEVTEVRHRWRIRVVRDSASDPERQDLTAVIFEAIYAEWAKYDAIALGGNCQLAWPSSVEPFELEENGVLYVGIDITLAVIVKTARVFTA